MPPEPPARIGLPLILFAVIAVTAMNLGAFAAPDASLPHGRLADSDAYLRLTRVLELRMGAGWFDDVTLAVMAPEGLPLHWTRPLDLLILLPALAMEWLGGIEPRRAIFIAGVFVSPVLHLFAAIAAAWAARGLWPGRAPWYAVLLMVATPGAAMYSIAGRSDHHALMLLTLAVGTGATLRALSPGGTARAAMAAGIAFGAGIWVSPEVLLGAAPMLLATGVAATLAVDGRVLALQGMRMGLGAAATVVMAILVERPPHGWFEVAYDRVSVHHLVLALLMTAVFLVAARVGAWPRMRRAVVCAAAAGIALAGLLLLFPRALLASLAQADATSASAMLPAVQEMQPLAPFGDDGFGVTLATMGGPPVIAIIAILLAAPAWRRDGRWPAGLAIAMALTVTLIAAFAARRFTLDLAVPAAVGGAGMVGLLLVAPWPRTEAMRAVLAAGLLFGLLGLPLMSLASPSPAGEALRPGRQAREAGCDGTAMARWLGTAQPGVTPGGPPPILMASDIFLGPEIAWRAPYHTVAGPYHRAGPALADTLTVFSTTDQAAARAVLHRRQVALLLFCAEAPGLVVVPDSLLALVRDGAAPAWLRPVPLPAALSSFRLFAPE
ncbi:hypothetical protein AAFN86_16755 [Roseomonas sp. CAU 1739]|uniref:hypothetical protein n=1 Tax=Roseomonas sp. CAU 1739 TaxID=3140364 RepID=UPI00325A5AC5